MAGVDPGPLSLRELAWMAEARGRADWAQTSAVVAAIWSANPRLKRPRQFRPSEFDPYCRRRRGIPVTASNIKLLKCLLPKRRRA